MRGGIRVREVPLREITSDPGQPRKHFDIGSLDQLAASSRDNGLLQPISVRELDTNSYLIIAGERRFRAAQLLGWKTIPSIVRRDVTDNEANRLQLLENIVREDLNPVEEARGYQAFIEDGYPLSDISKIVGLDVGQIGWRVQMLNAIEQILHLVATGEIKPGLAHAMSSLPPEYQQSALKRVTDEKLTYQECLWAIEKLMADSQREELPGFEKVEEVDKTPVLKEQREFHSAFDATSATVSRLCQDRQVDHLALDQSAVDTKLSALVKQINKLRRDVKKAAVQL